MDWSWISLIVLLFICSHQEYVQACDNDCKAALTHEFRNILKQELEPIYEILNEKFKPLDVVTREVGTLRRDTRDMFVMSEEILQHTQTVVTKQESMSRDLHSVKADVESYDSHFRDAESFSLNTSTTIQRIARDTDTLDTKSLFIAQNVNAVKKSLPELNNKLSLLAENVSAVKKYLPEIKSQISVLSPNLYDIKNVTDTFKESNCILMAGQDRDATCDPVCLNNGTCVGPNQCQCSTGWYGQQCQHAICEQGCLHGKCESPGSCICSPGWTADQCQQPICEPDCINGFCESPDSCKCAPHWTGDQCEQPTCDPVCLNDGACVGPNHCQCPTGWHGLQCQHATCDPVCLNDGTCVGPNQCLCSTGWHGQQCQHAICDPVCVGGSCGAPNRCDCELNWTGDRCENYDCAGAGGVNIGNQCLLLSEERVTWDDANQTCTNKPLGRLAVLADANQAKEVVAYLAANFRNNEYWLGGSDLSNEGTWLWSDGRPIDMGRPPWRSGEPNDCCGASGGEDCLTVRNGGYNDGACTYTLRYICELGDPTKY
ncbi:unnamed protein product [Meganyctiphanes norvegica]|uniref:Uncharacterized protein n=1 Tax=Meganyctiphanes norvegica TaxID=48144 RepID=A0AAV2QIA4_MEGNR